MNRRGFIKLIAGAVAALGLSRTTTAQTPKPQNTDVSAGDPLVFENNFNSYAQPPRGSFWIEDRDCPRDRIYITQPGFYTALGYELTPNGWERRKEPHAIRL